MGTFAAHDGLIVGRYRLREKIGRGGMGTVWRATDELLAREVAVKELHMDDDRSLSGATTLPTSSVDRTLREARAAALINHPNVVALHDIVIQEGRPWIVMELIEGRALSEVLAADGPAGAREAARIGAALLGALRAAHARGVLHRDIKPPNVLLEAGTGRVVLTDFGIARVSGATTITESGAFVGSPEYTAPERIAGRSTGPASDLWSLGVLLCVVLSGESPFRRDSLGGILQAVVQDEIRPPAAADPLLPVVRGLLERDPERRMGVDEAEWLLLTYLASGRMPGTGDRAGPRARRRPRRRRKLCARKRAHDTGPLTLRSAATSPLPPPPAFGPAPQGRTRLALMTGVAMMTLAGMGAGLAALLTGSNTGGVDDKPSHVASGPLSPSPHSPSAPPATATVDAPDGYHAVQDPAGFALAVPDGFIRSFEPPRVVYHSPGAKFVIGVTIQDRQEDGPMGALRTAAEAAPGRYPGYRDATVTPATHKDDFAALWEFTWDENTGDGSARHMYDVCWDEGDKRYDVWVASPDGQADEGRRYARTALDTFVRVRPVSVP
ncbi:serine/threonine-protein kinase [Streptomyces sp. NPDC051162]|uniref:serine/threonine-protein kinase n=1 Tax=unclassified Streptomyces TaxID=2593676 RepID=UPI00344A495B